MQHLISSQRLALVHPNHEVLPAHPLIADALCEAAARLADAFEPLWLGLGVFVRRVFWASFVVGSIGVFALSLFGMLPS